MVEVQRVRATDTTGQYVVTLSGEIDIANAEEVRDLGLAAVNLPDASTVTFDATAVSFLDSTGVGALLEVRNAGQAAGVDVRVRPASPQVTRVIVLSGLAHSFGLGG